MTQASNAQVIQGLTIIAQAASKGDREDRKMARILLAEAARRSGK